MSLIIKKTSWEDYLDPSGQAFVKALIMGAHGAGKTRSASFWPRPIFADTERGRMSLADRSVPYADIRSTADMDALLEHLRKECQKPIAVPALPDARHRHRRLLPAHDHPGAPAAPRRRSRSQAGPTGATSTAR